MTPYRLYFIGLQLVFLSHVTKSFVLLTANMEDVKKIARKFVSDSLAEKIADFVVKATNQKEPNVSEENDMNINEELFDDNSKQQSNIGRVTSENNNRPTKDFNLNPNKVFKQKFKKSEFEKKTKTAKTSQINWATENNSNKGVNINWEKNLNEISDEKYSKEAEEKPKVHYKQPKQDHKQLKYNEHLKQKYKQSKTDYEQQKLDNEHKTLDHEQPKIEHKPQKFDHKQSTIEYEQQKLDREQSEIEYEQQKLDQEQPNIEYEQQKLDHEEPKLNYEQQKLDHEEPKLNYEQTKTTRKPKNRPHGHKKKNNTKELRIPSVADKDIQSPSKNTQKPKQLSTSRNKIESTVLYDEKNLFYDRAPMLSAHKKKIPEKRGHRHAGFKSNEVKPDDSTNIQHETTLITTLQSFDTLTTKKEREEFDQYDSRNYPKSQFIATSGPVALPQVPMNKPWWEKDLPNGSDTKKDG